jgi:hypothetical protein
MVMGRIALGPQKDYRLSSDEHPDVVKPSVTVAYDGIEQVPLHMPVSRTGFWLLIECFSFGNSRGMYWAGKGNRIERRAQGIEITFNVHEARKIPLDMRDVAQGLADAMNALNRREGNQDEWRVIEHGFC